MNASGDNDKRSLAAGHVQPGADSMGKGGQRDGALFTEKVDVDKVDENHFFTNHVNAHKTETEILFDEEMTEKVNLLKNIPLAQIQNAIFYLSSKSTSASDNPASS